MPNEKASQSIPFRMSDEDFERTARNQRSQITALADRLDSGGTLDDRIEHALVVLALRKLAESIPLTQKGKQGPSPKMCPGTEALCYAMNRIVRSHSHGEALVEIADRFGISEVAVAKGIKPYRQAAFAIIGTADPGNRMRKQPK